MQEKSSIGRGLTGQAKFQELVTSLYLSSHERAKFFDEPERTLEAYGLDGTENIFSEGIQKQSIGFYANSLKKKRFKELSQFIPLTVSRWGSMLQKQFNLFSDAYIPVGPKKHIADLIMFKEFLLQAHSDLSYYAKDCLKFELIPWEMNFKIEREKFVFKLSGQEVHIVKAYRTNRPRCRFFFFHSYVPSVIKRIGNNKLNRDSEFSSKIASLAICLRLPVYSRLLEWYIPIPRWGGAVENT